jgi:hypothetical protein
MRVLSAVAATFAAMVVVFFLRFWRDSRDRFFLIFAGAFVFLAAHWAVLATVNVREHSPQHYALRLVGFLLIIAAIIDKNRR